MRRNTVLAAGLLAVMFSISGCGKTPESIANDMASKMSKLVDVLKTIKDVPSAKAAAPQIEQIGKDMASLKADADKLKVKPDELAALQKKMEAKYGQVGSQLQSEMIRIGQLGPDVMMEVDKSMMEIGKAMSQ